MSDEKKAKVSLYWKHANLKYEKVISVEAETVEEAKEAFLFLKENVEASKE